MIFKLMHSNLKKTLFVAFSFALLITCFNTNAQRKSKKKVGYGVYTSSSYTDSGYGVNFDLNFNVISNKQRFGVGMVMVTTPEILSGANAYYRLNIVENPKIFTKRPITGLEFFMQAQFIWRVTPTNYFEYINKLDSNGKIIGVDYVERNEYVSAIEFLIGPGVHYWITPNISADLAFGVGRYVNSPKKEEWFLENRGASGLNYSVRIGLGYKF